MPVPALFAQLREIFFSKDQNLDGFNCQQVLHTLADWVEVVGKYRKDSTFALTLPNLLPCVPRLL